MRYPIDLPMSELYACAAIAGCSVPTVVLALLEGPTTKRISRPRAAALRVLRERGHLPTAGPDAIRVGSGPTL